MKILVNYLIIFFKVSTCVLIFILFLLLALVFFGRKLALDQKLETIQHLNENRPLYIICQKENNQKSKENKEEINKKLQACRASYRALIEDALPQVSAEAFKLVIFLNELILF